MGLKLKTAPTGQVVTTAETKLYLRIDHSTEDALIDMMILSATKLVEDYLKRSLLTQVWEKTFDGLPVVKKYDEWWDGVKELPINFDQQCVNYLKLDNGPVQEIEDFKYYDFDNTEGTFDFANKTYLINERTVARLVLNIGEVFPVNVRKQKSYLVEYTTGYGDADDVPTPIKHSILMVVANMYENRGDGSTSIPDNAKSLLENYRVIEVD